MRSEMKKIRITSETHRKIRELSLKLGLKQITVLEYLLSGKIDLEELH